MPEIRQPWLISSLPPSSAHKRAALAVSTFLLVAFVITVPFAKVPLPQLNIYIPLVATVMFLNDLMTANLLLAQFSIVRSRALLSLANGYLFTALVVAVYGLVWPGAFHPTGLFGAGPQTRPWLYLVWHAGLPISVIAYALLRSKEHKTLPVTQDSVRTFIFASIACNVLIVGGLTWFVTRFEGILPVLVTPLIRSSDFSRFVTGAILFISIVAFVLQWRRRQRSVLDLWLSVVTLTWLLGSIIFNIIDGRYDVAWYAMTGFSIVSATLVLLILLSESAVLHAQLAISVLAQRREREGRRLSMDAMSAAIAHEVKQPLSAIVKMQMQLCAGSTERRPMWARPKTRSRYSERRTIERRVSFNRFGRFSATRLGECAAKNPGRYERTNPGIDRGTARRVGGCEDSRST